MYKIVAWREIPPMSKKLHITYNILSEFRKKYAIYLLFIYFITETFLFVKVMNVEPYVNFTTKTSPEKFEFFT